MLNQSQKAEKIFSQYRQRVESSLAFYNKLQTATPGFPYPTLARKIWREGMLAEIWATIATRLSGNKVNYLENWSQGLW